MATQNVCQYFKFGHCKFSETCNKLHVKEQCENQNCEIRSCKLRHPRICKFFRDYNRCKSSDYCSFKHVDNSVNQSQEILEKLNNLAKIINEKDIPIKNLAEKVRVLEEKVGLEDETLDENDGLERSVPCEKCNFVSKSKQGLQVHMRAKHKESKEPHVDAVETCDEGNQFTCENCDFVSENEANLKTHITEEHEKCNDCDFVGGNNHTIDVHVGKVHSEYLECGLCEFKADNLENLEMHLFTCEIYECNNCKSREKTLSDVKTYIKKDHINHLVQVWHMKMDRTKCEEVTLTRHWV